MIVMHCELWWKTKVSVKQEIQKEPCILCSAVNYITDPKGAKTVLGRLWKATCAQPMGSHKALGTLHMKAWIQTCIANLKNKVETLWINMFSSPLVKIQQSKHHYVTLMRIFK